jgi:hypothetical protein
MVRELVGGAAPSLPPRLHDAIGCANGFPSSAKAMMAID